MTAVIVRMKTYLDGLGGLSPNKRAEAYTKRRTAGIKGNKGNKKTISRRANDKWVAESQNPHSLTATRGDPLLVDRRTGRTKPAPTDSGYYDYMGRED